MRKLQVACLVPMVVVLAGFVLLGESLQKGEEALIQKKYQQAAGHLRKALEEETEGRRDRVLLLLARAQGLAGQHAEAVATYQRLISGHATSPLRAKARFHQAEEHAADGKYREAAIIFRDEVDRLIGLGRKEEIAGTYLGLAEKALAADPKDHARAVTFFDLALDLGLSPKKARSVRLQAAEARLKQGQHNDAVKRFAPLVKELSRDQGKLRAMLGLGRARLAGGDGAGARTVLRDVITLDKEAPEAADAAYEVALTYGVPTPQAGDLDRAVAALQTLAVEFPTHAKAKVARFLEASCYRHVGRSEDALQSLREFLAGTDDPDLVEIAQARAMVGDVLVGQEKLGQAISAWQEYLKAHPAHRDWERVQRAIVDAEYAIAQRAFESGRDKKGAERQASFVEARRLLTRFSEQHPLDARNPDILFSFGEMLYLEEKFAAAREAYGRCVSKYPGKQASSHAQFRIGEIYESKTFNYLEALRAYKLVTWGSYANQARARIVRLEKKHLALETSRTYRTGEPATFKLTSRNIEKVRVRIYKLDLETYFRSTHVSGAVETLDIEVIESDKTFDSKVEDYKKYRETERVVDVGFRDPGAYVVKVDDRELEATTMVLITDIALIAKTSRHEFFLLTQNIKQNRVEGGVKVVLSDGAKVVAEGVTAGDGVWRYKGDALKKTAKLSAFVVSAAGSGASTLSLSGLGYSQGLTPKGYLFTDRSAYQPGQRVNIKGILREVRSGLYDLPKGSYRLRVTSPTGRLMLQREVAFTEFGSFAAEVVLPSTAELGGWTVTVESVPLGKETFTGSFEVRRYERPKLTLTAELERRVVYRGEKIEGRFKLKYFFGEPAVGKRISYFLFAPDGGRMQGEGTTNAAGEVPFGFDTREFPEESIAIIQGSLVEENVHVQQTVPVVTTEFTPHLKTVRPLYLVGEPFDVDISIKDRSGKELSGRKGTVRLFRYQIQGKGRVEVEVASKEFETDAAGGSKVGFTAGKGGGYVLRVEARDRFGTNVTAQHGIEISGEDDKVKLRLLSDRQSYKVGETLKLRVVNRVGPRLVLRTIQGDGILSYTTAILPKGESTLKVVLEPLHAPNFALAFAMIDGREFHQVQREFVVSRDLTVKVIPPEGSVRPGAKVPVSVEVTDPKGRPVRTELALSLVDEALLSIYPDRAPAIGTFFYGMRRETSFRTLSSCTWAYKGRTTSVSAVLLAEERRLAVEESLDEDLPEEMEAEGRNSNSKKGVITGGTTFSFGGRGGGKAARKVYKGPGDASPGARRPSSAGPASPGAPQLESKMRRSRTDGRFVGGRENGIHLGEVDRLQMLAGKNGDFSGLLATSSISAGEYSYTSLPTNKPRTNFSETGGWISAVTTDGRGKARVEFDLPDSTTAWKIKARGVTANSYVGEGEGGFKTTKQLQVSLVVPPVLTEGDEVQATARVHNLTGEDRDLKIELSKKTGESASKVDRTVSTKAHREGEIGWKITAGGTADLILGMKAEAGALEDEVEVRVPVRPFGMEHRDGRSGSTTEQANFELSLPEGLEFGRLGMVIEIGPDPGRDLVAAALGAGYQPFNCRQILATNLALASRGLAALRVLEYIEGRGSAERADVSQLRGVVASVLARLVSSQGKDGGLSWVGGKTQDIVTTSQAAMFFALADRRGLPTAKPALNKAVEWLLRAIRSSRGPSRVHAAHGLAVAGRAGFDALNALHRGRASFGLGELARLALAWQAQQRTSLSSEVLRELRSKMKLGSGAFGEQKSAVPAADVEAVGLAAAALLAASATDSDGRRAIDWLKSRRRGASWGTPEATAAALQALVAAGGSERSAANRVTVMVTVNGQKLDGLSTAGMNNSRHDVPTDLLKPGGNEVVVALSGRGTVHYSAVLTGFASEFRAIDRREDLVTISRDMLPAYRRHDGKVVRPGFSSVQGRIDTFKNKLEWLRAGKSGRVETRFMVKDAFRKIMTPLVIEEPIPAGCSVPRSSVQGSFDHMIMEPDRITFFYREGRISDRIRYELQARFPGEYRVLPTRVFGASRPDLLAHGEVAKFTVKPSVGEEAHPYRMSPDELYQLGKAHFDAEDTDAAGRYLDELLSGWHRKQHQLRQTVFKDVARMMLFISIARGDDKATVKFFEDLKDLHEALVIPFDKIVAVGKAYLDIGEFERSLMVFKGTAEASFLKEAGVATTLEKLGELKASIGFLRKLLADYPDLNTMRLSLYSIGQKLAEIAARMPEGAAINEKIGRPAELRAMAVAAFREFLLMYPDDPLAEEVSFAWTTTHVEGKSLKQALEVAQKALDRYPASTFEDELLYTVGFIKFALGSHKEAQSLLRRVAEEQFVRPGGGRGRSENRYESIYLQGQIHHALGRPAEALAAYAKVKDRFSDAVEASDYFQRKDLTLPEVKTFGLDEKVELSLSYRNIKEAQVKVYRVDLMRLYLLKKSLNDIRGIKLHGIRAYTDKKIRLGNGKDYKSVEKKISLDLKEPGAYLVVARGGDLLASGMVLRSDLKIESQESLDVGRMRVNVKRGDDYLAAAHVKVIGSGDQRFRSGDTDLRGILVADDLIGRATVIVRKDDQYAFYRGEGIHQPSRYRPPTPRMPTKQVPQQQRGNDGQQQFEGWGNNFQFNSSNRARQTQWLQNEVMQKEQRGVEVYRTK